MTHRQRERFWLLALLGGVAVAAGLFSAGLYEAALAAIAVMVLVTSLLLK